MQNDNIYNIIEIDRLSLTPKYLQVANSICNAVKESRIANGYVLPSINELSYELDIARDTADRAYKHLKKLGVAISVPGKGFFISNAYLNEPLKIFLLFNKLSVHKKIIYDSIVCNLQPHALIDLYIYNNDEYLFKKYLQAGRQDYSYYVIIPHFAGGTDNACNMVSTLPVGKVILLNKLIGNTSGRFGAVYEDFKHDIYGALRQAIVPLRKYHTLSIIFPAHVCYPEEILTGFYSFCDDHQVSCNVVNDIEDISIACGHAYLAVMEEDLVKLVAKVIKSGLMVGQQVGVISYNETPVKQVILDGITTISTDFQLMGKMVAEMINNNNLVRARVPFTLTLRNSL